MHYIRPRGGKRAFCLVWWEDVQILPFRELLFYIMPPSKVCPQCETIVHARLKVCKSCEHVQRIRPLHPLQHTLQRLQKCNKHLYATVILEQQDSSTSTFQASGAYYKHWQYHWSIVSPFQLQSDPRVHYICLAWMNNGFYNFLMTLLCLAAFVLVML